MAFEENAFLLGLTLIQIPSRLLHHLQHMEDDGRDNHIASQNPEHRENFHRNQRKTGKQRLQGDQSKGVHGGQFNGDGRFEVGVDAAEQQTGGNRAGVAIVASKPRSKPYSGARLSYQRMTTFLFSMVAL